MFTKELIETAHNKVKSGADFPKYVKEIKNMGIKSHEVNLTDGTWIFKGVDGQVVQFKRGPENVKVSTNLLKGNLNRFFPRTKKGKRII